MECNRGRTLCLKNQNLLRITIVITDIEQGVNENGLAH